MSNNLWLESDYAKWNSHSRPSFKTIFFYRLSILDLQQITRQKNPTHFFFRDEFNEAISFSLFSSRPNNQFCFSLGVGLAWLDIILMKRFSFCEWKEEIYFFETPSRFASGGGRERKIILKRSGRRVGLNVRPLIMIRWKHFSLVPLDLKANLYQNDGVIKLKNKFKSFDTFEAFFFIKSIGGKKRFTLISKFDVCFRRQS